MENETEVLDTDDELRSLTPEEVDQLIGWTEHDLLVAQCVELREIRILLTRFAALGDMMAQLGSGQSTMLARLFGLGGNGG